jgi:hypothetical protein
MAAIAALTTADTGGRRERSADLGTNVISKLCSSSGHRPTMSGTHSVLRRDHPTTRGSNHDCTSDSYGGGGGPLALEANRMYTN